MAKTTLIVILWGIYREVVGKSVRGRAKVRFNKHFVKKSGKQTDNRSLTSMIISFFHEEKMAQKKLKLNIILSQTSSTKAEDDKRFIEFFNLLLSWNNEDLKRVNAKKV